MRRRPYNDRTRIHPRLVHSGRGGNWNPEEFPGIIKISMYITPRKPNPGYANGTVDGNGGGFFSRRRGGMGRSTTRRRWNRAAILPAGASRVRVPPVPQRNVKKEYERGQKSTKEAKKCGKQQKSALFVLTLQHISHGYGTYEFGLFCITGFRFAIEMIDETPKYNSVSVACYIAAMVNASKFSLNMTKLQKLLYIAYGSYLALKNRRLTNEHPQAWPYGPVFPTTRNRLIRKNLSSINLHSPEIGEIKDDSEMQSLVRLVLDGFGDKNATTLSVWSHQPGSPWDRVTSQEGFKWGERIPDEYIQEYFNSILIRNGQ